jgi:hypothetical protein
LAELIMAKAPITETIAAELTVPERVLLFCLASGTDWAKAGVTHKGDIALPNVNGVGRCDPPRLAR